MNTQLSNLIPLASLGDDLLLLVKNTDFGTSGCRCCQIDLDTQKFYFYENIEQVLKFTPFEEVSELQWEFFRVRIYQKVSDELIVEILEWFENEYLNEVMTKVEKIEDIQKEKEILRFIDDNSEGIIKNISIDIEKLKEELYSLNQQNYNLSESRSYHDSYHVFVDYFRKLDQIKLEHFIIGSHFVYGWMPTILNMNLETFESENILKYLNLVKNGANYIEKDDLSKIIPHINNSLVGTSKLLHFINPQNYAIWDSNIFHYFFPEKKSTYGINNPDLYFEYINSLKLAVVHTNFNELYEKIKHFFNDDKLTPFRAIESLIFEIVKNKKRIQNSIIIK